jgi:hypothetical protein
MFPKHSTDYYSEVFSACFVAIAIFLFLQNRFYSGAVMLCLSVWNTPGTAVAGALLLTVFAYREWRLRYLSVIFFLALGIVVENYVKYGVFFPHEYLVVKGDVSLLPYSGRPGFSYPMFFGVISVLLSPGKGLLFYMPPLVFLLTATLWLKEGITKQIIFYGSFYLLGLVLLYSRWWAWHGDWFWGPRFFLFASILASFILIQIWQTEKTSLTIKVICFVAALVSFWVGAQGIMYGQDFLDDCYRRPIGVDFMCHYVPEYSPLWRFFIVLPLITGRRVAYAIYFVLVAITVLWNPGREILRDFSILIKNEWKEKFGKKGMIRW